MLEEESEVALVSPVEGEQVLPLEETASELLLEFLNVRQLNFFENGSEIFIGVLEDLFLLLVARQACLVVVAPSLRVRKHLVRLGHFYEPALRALLVQRLVRVQLQSQVLVAAADFLRSCSSRKIEHLIQRHIMDGSFRGFRTACSTNSWPSVLSGLVCQREFPQVLSDHVKLYLHRVVDLPVVYRNDTSDHLGHYNSVSEVGLYRLWLFAGRTVLLGFSALFEELFEAERHFPAETPSLTRPEERDEFSLSEFLKLIESLALVGILANQFLLLLFFNNLDHQVEINNIIYKTFMDQLELNSIIRPPLPTLLDNSFTQRLRATYPNYNNGYLHRPEHQRALREQVSAKQKTRLDQLKLQWLDELMHPENIYIRQKRKNQEQNKQPYGINIEAIKKFRPSLVQNLSSVLVNYRLPVQETEIRRKVSEVSVDIQVQTRNYIKEFCQRFQNILKRESCYWQLLVFDVLKMIDTYKNQQQLTTDLFLALKDQKAVKYLTVFKNDIRLYLKQTRFFQQLREDERNSLKKRVHGQQINNFNVVKHLTQGEQIFKEPQKKALPSQFRYDQDVNELDFIRLSQSKIMEKIPTLRRSDFKEFIFFRIEPLPKKELSQKDLLPVKQNFPDWAHSVFLNTTRLNFVQSRVYPKAFLSEENLLICAPTGSGKTNVALMAVLQKVKNYILNGKVSLTVFKIVYVSPMKALASEVVEKFSKSLNYLGIKTRQFTGDMQLSQKELAQTHIIVTTPQKWDVVTRKSNQLIEYVKLIIFDEIHLLNDERGPVIESIVARTFRNVQRTQKNIRMVGLSATLPNFVDVAHFLHVDTSETGGCFFFDSSIRPVPLVTKFVGVKGGDDMGGQSMRRRQQDVFNEKCYDFIIEYLKMDKQVIVFVHSRRQTSMYCKYMVERAKEKRQLDFFSVADKKQVSKKRILDNDLGKLAFFGVGFHNAGMARPDRNVVEELFTNGTLKVLCATATLAWGVNLPAYAVIIKGTDIFDPSKGGMHDISILDVQQMFGRAGRPQYDTKGQAILMTQFKKVSKFMGNMTDTSDIQSQFHEHLNEALNAQIAAGSITNQHQAFEWIKYTFFAIRVKRNPMIYNCQPGKTKYETEMNIDIFLRRKIEQSINELDKMKLIRFDRKNLLVQCTQLGRITSIYYIRCQTMVHLCEKLHIIYNNEDPRSHQKRFQFKTDLELLRILAESKEFENIRVRPQQQQQLRKAMNVWILQEKNDFGGVKLGPNTMNVDEGPIIETPEKVLLLFQAYLVQHKFQTFSLLSDMQYVVQSGIRLLRCMLDLTMQKGQALNCQTLFKWSKFLENRMQPNQNPLKQFCRSTFTGFNSMKNRRESKEGFLSQDLYKRLEDSEGYMMPVDQLLRCTPEQIAAKTRSSRGVAQTYLSYLRMIPKLNLQYRIKPVAQTILKIDIEVQPDFTFNRKWHLSKEIYWLIIDNQLEILHSESFPLNQRDVINRNPLHFDFYIPFRQDIKRLRICLRSERWIVQPDQQEYIVDLDLLGIKFDKLSFTPLLKLQPLPVAVLPQKFRHLYKFPYFNPIQTQLFHILFHSNQNVLVGAPTGSGKTIISELAILRMFEKQKDKCVFVAPLKSLVKERINDWKLRFQTPQLKAPVVQLTGDYTPDIQMLMKARIIVTTPQKWDGITRNHQNRRYISHVALVVFDQIHLLGQDRGPVIQVIVSRMNRINKNIRMIGLSTAMANSLDVGEWFGAGRGFFNFRPSVRPVPVQIHFDGFPQKNYCPRMATMDKPAFNHIKMFSDDKPVLIFVSSRRQTRLTALNLITFASQSYEKSPYIKCSSSQLKHFISQTQDQYLQQTLSFGIAMHHAGLGSSDRKICQHLFVNGKVQILIATSTLAWGVNFPARLVIIKGTQFFDPKKGRYVDMPVTDILQMIGRAGRPQFDNKGVACVYVQQSKKNFYRKYLNDPFPIESALLEQIDDHLNAQISARAISSKEHTLQWLTWTYLFRRLLKNPQYYGLETNQPEEVKKFLQKTVRESLGRLEKSNCIRYQQGQLHGLFSTRLGVIGSYYYVKHQTMHLYNQRVKQGMGLADILRLLSESHEFQQVPMRHNDDNYCKEMAKDVPIKLKLKYEDPNDKTFLLYQSHLFNIEPPIRDFHTDCKLVIDSTIRLLSALLDLSCEKGLLDTSLNCIHVMQMLHQGMWWNDSPWRNIPFFSKKVIQFLQDEDIYDIAELAQRRDAGFFQRLERVIQKEFGQGTGRESSTAIKTLPVIRMETQLQFIDEEGKPDLLVKVHLNKENRESDRVEIQKTTRIKEAGWYLVVGLQSQNKVLAQKKVNVKVRTKKQLQVMFPKQTRDGSQVKVWLLSDCYLGLDQVQKIVIAKNG